MNDSQITDITVVFGSSTSPDMDCGIAIVCGGGKG